MIQKHGNIEKQNLVVFDTQPKLLQLSLKHPKFHIFSHL